MIIQSMNAKISAALSYIESNLASELCIASMSCHVELSSAQFHRLFLRDLGCTPWQYVIQRRLERARAALATGVTVRKCLQGSGFRDEREFYRKFRARYQLTPGTFRGEIVASPGRNAAAEAVEGDLLSPGTATLNPAHGCCG